jgi:nicotinamide-nucleotide amidase
MASAEIITIGTELLLGHLVDSNTAEISRALADVGIDVYRQTSVGDNTERIAGAVRDGLGRADIVICAGGLGPTVDDLTRDGVSAATGHPLVLHESSLRHIEGVFARLGRTMADNNRQQAMIPQGAVVLENPNGSAPGFIVDDGAHAIVAIPGPPREMSPMLHDRVIPWLTERFGVKSVIVTRVLHTIGVAESDVDARIADLFREGKNPSIAVLAHPGVVDVKITAKAKDWADATGLIAQLEPIVRERLGDCIYAIDGGSIQSSLGDALRARGWRIATAESCTGGRVAVMITSVPGSSDYFCGSVVAYSDESKRELLDVPTQLIESHGAVSEEVASAMALGARARFSATIALSVTGIAGPGGGSAGKPVGLVYVGLSDEGGKTEVLRMKLLGDREMIQRRASLAALTIAWKAARLTVG